jgi:Na+-translocating ferredoxin:NAD+ oxidoreductase RnfD subunit
VSGLDTTLRLSPAEQAQNVCALQQAIFHEPDMSSEWLAVGLWVVYAALALFWCRAIARRWSVDWLAAVGQRVIAPLAVRRRIRWFHGAAEPAIAPILCEPAAARI